MDAKELAKDPEIVAACFEAAKDPSTVTKDVMDVLCEAEALDETTTVRSSLAAAEMVSALACGCETKTTDQGVELPWSWCGDHGGNPGPAGLYSCGECGFRSRSFERLERHVLGDHLGVEVA